MSDEHKAPGDEAEPPGQEPSTDQGAASPGSGQDAASPGAAASPGPAPVAPAAMGTPWMRVTRGEQRDVAEWVVGPGYIPPPSGRWGHITPGESRSAMPMIFAIVASLVVVAATVWLIRRTSPTLSEPLAATIADLSAVHSGVSAGGADVRKLRRLQEADVVETDDEGRARLRLDDGTAFVIDRNTRLTITKTGIALAHGRVFVQGALGARTEIDLEGAVGIVSGASAGIERTRGGAASLYAASAEITVRAGGAESTVHAGETAQVSGGKVTVAPARSFDDWTGGMAAPWGAKGAPRRAVGELWGRPTTNTAGEVGSPLTLRSHDVRATITGEIAETEIRTVFFNGGSDPVVGDFRMALPPGAIVQRFAIVRGETVSEGRVALASRDRVTLVPAHEVLEWAGEGWVRGTVPMLVPGVTVAVIVGYVEWLPITPKPGSLNLTAQYRYPMVSDAAPPLIGEFSAYVDARPSAPISMAAGLGARVAGQAVEVRRPDFRPTADLVVDVEIAPWTAPARLYVAPPTDSSDVMGTIVVRTETPAATREDGVTLALVLDTSASVEPALLDAGRSLVEAILNGLGAHDRVIVLAADEAARPVGPEKIGPVDAARSKATLDALARLSPGGATDLGRALEGAADALPEGAPAAMVIYIGDGWPSVGDSSVDAINARLARRPGGAPRIGAVAVGPLCNKYALAALVRGSGTLLEMADRGDAPRAAVALIAEALQPTVAGVEIAFGPSVERIYPRGARAVVSGETVTAVGRVRGEPPTEITIRWRDAKGVHEEKRALVPVETPNEKDVARRWAAARVEEIALTGKGREAATDVALRAGLLTPWTGWVAGGHRNYIPSALTTRILDLALGSEAGFSAALATPRGTFGTLTNVPHDTEDSDEESEAAFKTAIAAAAARVLADAGPAVRACRDSRAALRPEIGGFLNVGFALDGEGRAAKVKVRGSGDSNDDALNRCVAVVIEGLRFPSSGLRIIVDVNELIALPPVRATLGKRRCSPTSTLLLPLRRGVWAERLARSAAWTVYSEAKQSCELPTWTDRRTLLELILLHKDDSLASIDVARRLADAGDDDAAALLRKEAVRRAKSPDELRLIKAALVGDERYPFGVFRKQYQAATGDPGRLAVVRRFLSIAPHDARLRRRLLALLEAQGMKQELVDEVRRARLDPFADAALLADGASALRRSGDEPEARRAFGELAERAPHDPWARAFLGDRLRNEGWFDDAARAYTVLEDLMPDDPAAILRLALAHAGSGRLDIAQRMLSRVAQTGGRAGDGKLGDLAGRLATALLVEASATSGVGPEEVDRIVRAALELPRPAAATLVLVRSPAGSLPLKALLVRGPKDAREEREPEVAAEGIGLYTLRMDGGDTAGTVLRLRRPEELAPAKPTRVRIDALVPEGPGKPPRLVTTEVDIPIHGKPIEVTWTGSAWKP